MMVDIQPPTHKDLIHDRYNLICQLGQGGFGKTYLAEDITRPNTPRVVLKQFSPTALNDSVEALRLFKLESDRLAQVGCNEHIPEFLESFEDGGQHYIIQQYIDGQNLAQELLEQGPATPHAIQDLLNEILPVLGFIHENQLLHRDIKPENIIRRSDGRLFLVDFGAAKAVSETVLAKTGTTIGSAAYVSPEQSVGKAGYASDLYSLGVTCIHLLTNVPPFDLIDLYSGGWHWRDYLSDGARIKPDLADILDRMIERTLTKRFRTASEVLTQLKKLDRKEIALVRRDRIAKKARIRLNKAIKAKEDFLFGKEDLENSIVPQESFWLKPWHLYAAYLGLLTALCVVFSGITSSNPQLIQPVLEWLRSGLTSSTHTTNEIR
jgi:serine/threonine protein kinase